MWILLYALLAVAGSVDFSGTWTLDLAASGSLDAILVAEGASWPERQLAKTMTATQTITQTATAVTITIDSPILERTETTPTDGTPQSGTTKDGDPRVARTMWDGAALVTTAVVTKAEGAEQMSVRRTLEDGNNTLRQHVTVTTAGGQTLSVDRIYRRVR